MSGSSLYTRRPPSSARRQDEYRDEPFTVLEADFYGANALLPLSDEALVAKVRAARPAALCLPAALAQACLVRASSPLRTLPDTASNWQC